MLKSLFGLVLFFSSQYTLAQGVKPVSLSYEKLLRCFPELQDETLSFKVELNRLKDLIDEKFVTSQSQLRQRRIRYLNAEKQLMSLTLRTKFAHSKKMETELFLQSVDEKGVTTDLALTKNQRLNPDQAIINNFLLNGSIKSDEYSYVDTKLNGMMTSYRRNFKEIEEIELRDTKRQRSVLCEKQTDLGIICTCSKK